MYEEIMNEIKSNLGSNEELNKKYLSSQIEVYKDHPYNKEIIKEISRLMWDCLSESQKQEFADISNKENPIMDILNDIYYDIEEENYETPLKKLEKFMESFPNIFEDDKVNEYHFFTNPLEEMIFRKYIGLKKELRYIPDNQPLLDLYYVYGFLLLESQQYDKAEEYLKKAIKINPVSSRIILELTEIYKVHTYTFNEYFIRTCDALQYAYYPQDIARCYRNLGYYYIEENQMETALALLIYSMEYEANPLAYTEINYIQSNDFELTLDECIEIIESKNIQLG
ncbi:tetratricopeptide repeat protein [Methanobrevibacter sp. V74]|uniref:tetratricopeptide repeat protein n=1 Tax=Methanobrevibacter sp. V74 TaxID=3064279 RepID=UPI002733956C|nr:tetratricopeptide repeat protein [Methanobrevibacter sp. V74]